MKKIVSIIIVISVCFILINVSLATSTLETSIQEPLIDGKTDVSITEKYVSYSTGQYMFKLPYDYERINENSFYKSSEEEYNNFYIKSEKYEYSEFDSSATEDDIYNDEMLNALSRDFESQMEQYSKNGAIDGIFKSIPNIDNNTINEIKNNTTYSLESNKICNVTKNNYKAFYFYGIIDVLDIVDFYIEQYIIYTSNYVTVISIGSLDGNYIESNEAYSIINNIKINDDVLSQEIESSIFTDEEIIVLIVNLIITVVIYCIIPIIMKLFHGAYDNKNASKIALINSIVIAGICILIKSAQGITTTSGAAFVYYYVNKWILTKSHSKKRSKNKINFIECKVCGKKIPYNENGTCEECHIMILERLESKKLSDTKYTSKLNIINNANISQSQKDKIITKLDLMSEKDIIEIISSFQNKDEETNQERSDQRFCVNCGMPLQEHWKFCNFCGYKLK